LRYDNLKSVVKKILRGHRREETARFIAFRSHWRFQSEFCTPEEPHEKGGIENEAGYFRRNHWVPMPKAARRDRSSLPRASLCVRHTRRCTHARQPGGVRTESAAVASSEDGMDGLQKSNPNRC
jgi:transposase